jgi:hypothetical protein
MQQKHGRSPWHKKFQTAPSAGKQMAKVFGDIKQILMVEWLPQSTAVNNVIYSGILTSLLENPSNSVTSCRVMSMLVCTIPQNRFAPSITKLPERW